MTRLLFPELEQPTLRKPVARARKADPVAADRLRLNAQCQRILERLRQGRVSNRELSAIALKYTGRVSELRQAGHSVKVVERNRETGLTWYELEATK